MSFKLFDNIFPGIASGYKRISTSFVVPQSLADLSGGNWNNVGTQVQSVNNLLPNNLKISDRATYLLCRISGALFSNNAAGLTHSFTFKTFYNKTATIEYSEQTLLGREFSAVAPANTEIYECTTNIIIPVIDINATVCTVLTFVGNANNGLNFVHLLGYWDSIINI